MDKIVNSTARDLKTLFFQTDNYLTGYFCLIIFDCITLQRFRHSTRKNNHKCRVNKKSQIEDR